MARKNKKISQGLAIVSLLLNILILPGLGSIVGGRTKEGIPQLILAIVAIPLSMILIGIPLMFATWVWALVTGIQIIQNSK